MTDFNDDQGEYTVNIGEVLKADDIPDVVKSLARSIQKNPYTKVGDYLQSLSNTRMDELQDLLDTEDEDYRISNMLLMAMMLAQAEGVFLTDEKLLQQAVNMFPIFVTIASLQRKGLVRAYYENMSFGEDMMNAKVAEKINDD